MASANYSKRLIEVDLPIRAISAAARSGRRKRKGNIASLHFWWARRPTAACRAVAFASLVPDPVSLRENDAERASAFSRAVKEELAAFAPTWVRYGSSDAARLAVQITKNPDALETDRALRGALLLFVADLAWEENAQNPAFVGAAQQLVRASHEAVGRGGADRPLIVDPFAGGGALPLEAHRLGADVFASDLNPVAVILNRVLLEHAANVPRLSKELENRGKELLRRSRASLGALYPPDEDGSSPIAYLWARTLSCSGPGCGKLIPLLSNLSITKRRRPPIVVKFGDASSTRVELSVVELQQGESAQPGTVRGGVVACPGCGHSIKAKEYRRLAREGRLGEWMYGVVLQEPDGKKRKYRTATEEDRSRYRDAEGRRDEFQAPWSDRIPTYPDEPISADEPRRLNIRHYGFTSWGQVFNRRQQFALGAMGAIVVDIARECTEESGDAELGQAVLTALSLCVSNVSHYLTAFSMYLSDGMISAFIQSSAIAMRSDYAEANPLMPELVGGLEYQLGKISQVLEAVTYKSPGTATVCQAPAQELPLPDDSADVLLTDPPYFYSIPYADLSDLFYVWLRRFLADTDPTYVSGPVTPKDDEATQSLPHSKSPTKRDRAHYESALEKGFQRSREVVRPSGLGVVVFAHSDTSAWEALLGSLVRSGWVITASWPIDTENRDRMLANRQSTLSSSVHLICRPRENEDGTLRVNAIGDWREVLRELPRRIHEWMPRLSAEGISGADAIIACLGPAMEVFSQYTSVEKASGETVSLEEYMRDVWSAVAREALSMVFDDVDASGFEEDARLTAMWLWTARTTTSSESSETNESSSNGRGYSMEYDAARKIAQGLGVHLETLPHLVETAGDTATLLSAGARAKHLFGAERPETAPPPRRRKAPQMTFSFERELEDLAGENSDWSGEVATDETRTVLDRLHQSMILFGAGRSKAVRRLLVEDGIGADPLFWRLAQALSALYPAGCEEKRWVDGVLGRKKGMGF